MSNYTPKQMQIMRFIHDFRTRSGFSPTLEEIGEAIGIHRVTVHQHVKVLISRGGIKKDTETGIRNLVVIDPQITGVLRGSNWEKIKKHLGHRTEIAMYDDGSVTIECIDCDNEVLVEEKRPS